MHGNATVILRDAVDTKAPFVKYCTTYNFDFVELLFTSPKSDKPWQHLIYEREIV